MTQPKQAGAAAPTFVRELHLHDTGPDVLAVKRALKVAGHGHGIALTETLGSQAVENLRAFQTASKLKPDGVYGPATHKALAGYFDDYGASLLAKETAAIASSYRFRFLDTVDWTVQHHAQYDYTEEEPYRSSMLRLAPRPPAGTRVGADCSLHFIGCGHWTKLKHPLFHANGFTGTILAACKHITAAQAQPGDAVVYVGPRRESGVHVTILVKKLPGGDWMVANHGTQGQPVYTTLSEETANHRAVAPTLVYCQLPA